MIKKQGFPEEGEIVLCTVTKVYPNYVFVNLDEFGRSGMIHISEISPGRIRNIRDYVVEGKKVICVVLRINKEKGHIDVSLRRVSESQKRAKSEGMKQTQKIENIMKYVGKKLNKDPKQIFDEISEKILAKYDDMNSCFLDVVNDKVELESIGITIDVAKLLTEIIKQRVKAPEINIKIAITLSSYQPDGVEIIKKALTEAEKIEKDHTNIKYAGAGKFFLNITAPDYKKAEKIFEKIKKQITVFMEKNKSECEFERIEAK